MAGWIVRIKTCYLLIVYVSDVFTDIATGTRLINGNSEDKNYHNLTSRSDCK